MNTYKELFVKKSLDSFETYIDKVADGKSQISGAVLSPAKLMLQATTLNKPGHNEKAAAPLLRTRVAAVLCKTLDAQWATLVKRIKDSGILANSIAVCDVSGSMGHPAFADKTSPIHTAIGISLLLAEIVEPPFGGAFITFSAEPKLVSIGGPDDTRTLLEKCAHMTSSDWGMNTDFAAVFERLILPMAVQHKVKPEDMVKQIFVFSDMQFDVARSRTEPLETAYERLKRQYAAAGYEVPQLVFWNLNGGGGSNETVAPRPVMSGTEGTMLVSGYSQGLLKMFLEDGHFDEEAEVEVEDEDVEDEDAEGMVQVRAKKRKVDPMVGLRKAVGHKAYSMLKVVD
ncbi:hypothetical protein MMC34_001985 [Xylographa carneopallida]|nr:hypothetical protein [Xylographa carneopallida]